MKDVLIDSVTIDALQGNKINVSVFQRQLLQKHSALLALEEEAPNFTLEGVPSRLNQPFTSLTDTYDVSKKGDPLFPPSKKNKE